MDKVCVSFNRSRPHCKLTPHSVSRQSTQRTWATGMSHFIWCQEGRLWFSDERRKSSTFPLSTRQLPPTLPREGGLWGQRVKHRDGLSPVLSWSWTLEAGLACAWHILLYSPEPHRRRHSTVQSACARNYMVANDSSVFLLRSMGGEIWWRLGGFPALPRHISTSPYAIPQGKERGALENGGLGPTPQANYFIFQSLNFNICKNEVKK